MINDNTFFHDMITLDMVLVGRIWSSNDEGNI